MRPKFSIILWLSTSSSELYIVLTHWGRVTHICVSKLTTIGSDNGLSPGRRQAIIWTNAGLFLIWPLGTNFSEISIEIHTFSFKKMHLKMSSAKWRPFCLGLNVLMVIVDVDMSACQDWNWHHLEQCLRWVNSPYAHHVINPIMIPTVILMANPNAGCTCRQ